MGKYDKLCTADGTSMAPQQLKRRASGQIRSQSRPLKRKREDEDLDALDNRVKAVDPKEGRFDVFSSLPLSQPTASGLQTSHYKTLTDVQKKIIPYALRGSDILGAAKTGSGKTLAFLIPVLENLCRKRWTEHDGLGALILAPTRELAIQIFEVLKKIGRYHTFSAGLVIGGKSLQEEQERLGRMHILVCTPGRMLQHMDQTAAFEIGNLQMLVLDEADRILDLGFQGTVDAIIEHLPKERQTLLFSATQTKKVSDLARLSLRGPEYLSVHEAANSATPSTLQQNYIVTPLPEKLNTLWSFIRSNLKSKILVFLSSSKQVRFVYEAFRHMRPGIPLMHLHGRQKQSARLDITVKFSASRQSCLFATDVAARGLDFPTVDWVIQLDCPEDADTYIHRVGRTARYGCNGRAVLFLEPSEEKGMLERLDAKRVNVDKINVRQKKQQSISNQLQNMCFKDPELKYLGQKAFVSYVKSIHVQKDRDVFKLNELPLEEFSASLGLPGAPRIKFGKGDTAKALKNAPRGAMLSSEDEDDREAQTVGHIGCDKTAPKTKYDRMFERRNRGVLADHYTKLIRDEDEDAKQLTDVPNADVGFLSVKRRLDNASMSGEDLEPVPHTGSSDRVKVVPGLGKEPLVIDSKRKAKLLNSRKKTLKLKEKGKKLVFDDEGIAHEVYELEDEEKFKSRGPVEVQKAKFLEEEQERFQAVDLADKQAAKAKRREKREKREKRKTREAAENGEDEGGPRVVLVPFDSDQDEQQDREEKSKDAASAIIQPLTERPRKWFEDETGNERKFQWNRKALDEVEEPRSLEDLEAMAASLLV